jgi:uncharacterized membrane protein
MIKKVFGFGFGFGIGIVFYLIVLVLAIFSRNFCGRLCNNFCNGEQISSCYFLFLFVGIVFIVSASCLIIDRKTTK